MGIVPVPPTGPPQLGRECPESTRPPEQAAFVIRLMSRDQARAGARAAVQAVRSFAIINGAVLGDRRALRWKGRAGAVCLLVSMTDFIQRFFMVFSSRSFVLPSDVCYVLMAPLLPGFWAKVGQVEKSLRYFLRVDLLNVDDLPKNSKQLKINYKFENWWGLFPEKPGLFLELGRSCDRACPGPARFRDGSPISAARNRPHLHAWCVDRNRTARHRCRCNVVSIPHWRSRPGATCAAHSLSGQKGTCRRRH